MSLTVTRPLPTPPMPTAADAVQAGRVKLLCRYDGNAPRYTSYPTALQFTPAVDEAVYRGWLSELPANEAISLYVHIPFCARLCWYCGCNTRAVKAGKLVSDYVANLEQELALLEGALPGRMPVGSVHLGGGTPNMLSVDDLTQLFGALRHVFRFRPGADIAAELDPSVLTRDWVRAAVFHGLTRASLGVQALAPHVQAAVNRRESFEVVERAAGWLREAGIQSLNLDLMYGLPRQTVADVKETLDAVLTLKPERIALFGYAHVPWAKPHQKLIDAKDLPVAAARLEQSEAAAEHLAAEGYVRLGLDHFALPHDPLAVAAAGGRLRRNFQGYTDDPYATLIGLGASSIGSLPQGYVQNDARELTWRDTVAAGRLPIVRGVALTDEDRFRAAIIERLMCDLAVDLPAVCLAHARDPVELMGELTQLEPFVADGLITVEGGRIAMTDFGRPFLRAVAAVFDQHLKPAAGHARVV
jgi:oxygen-independent coproporphyrinogen-3 oxidase